MTLFNLRLIGSAEIVLLNSAEKPITTFRSRRVLALLAYLVVNKKAIPRPHLVELIWPDKNEEKGRSNLRWALSQLKKLVPDAIVTTRETAQFRLPAGCTVDLYEIMDALESTVDSFPLEIVDVVRGEFLDGFFFGHSAEYEMWLVATRESIRQRTATIFSYAAETATSLGKTDTTLKIIDKWLIYDPWDEAAYRFKMELLARSSRIDEALDCYKLLKNKLQQELDTAPSIDTELLYQNLLKRTTLNIKTNLPPQPTRFIGRTAEGTKLKHLLQRDAVRLVTVVGAGGMGKTRIIIETAGQMLSHFLDGVIFVPLASIDDVSLVPHEILERAIQADIVLPRRGVDAITYLQEALYDQEVLLLLDNFEHLMGATPFIVTLLNQCPQLKIMVSSRERLHVRWERIVQMGGLPLSDGEQLFTQMAEQADPAFRVTNQNRPHIHRICELVEGMPLALELSASWVRLQSCQEIADAIEKSLNVLSVTHRDRPDRHLSVRASFDYSWQMLSEKERIGLKKLAVFPGGFTIEAAQAIADIDLPMLAVFVDKSLIQQKTIAKPTRYHMHQLLRQFSAEQGGTSETGELLDQFCEYYATLLNRNQDEIMKGSAQALDAIEAELPNIRQAWSWMLKQQKLQCILGSFQPFAYFYDMRCLWQEGHDVYQRMESALYTSLEADRSNLAIVMALVGVMVGRANFLSRLGRATSAETLLYQSLDLIQPLRNAQGEAFIKFTLGRIASQTYRYDEAEALYWESHELAKSAKDIPGMARTLVNLSSNSIECGNYEDGVQYAQAAEKLFEECGDQRGKAIAQGNLGLHAGLQNDPDTCLRHAQDVKKAAHEIGSALLMIFSHFLTALTHFLTDDMESASRSLEAASREAYKLGDTKAVIEHDSFRVQTLLRCGKYEEATQLATQILQSTTLIDDYPTQIRGEIAWGAVLQQTETDDLAQVETHLLTALQLAKTQQAPFLLLKSAVMLSNYYFVSNQLDLSEEIAAHVHKHPKSNAILRKLLHRQENNVMPRRSFSMLIDHLIAERNNKGG